jgi:hypothetical protein
MKDADAMNLLAVLADSEARSTATLVEVIAATTLFKLQPPAADDVATVEISEADIAEAMAGFSYDATYKDGVMTVRVSRNQDCLIPAQPEADAEVTSGAD